MAIIMAMCTVIFYNKLNSESCLQHQPEFVCSKSTLDHKRLLVILSL